MYDVIVVGGGPAGLTTAIYCCRSDVKTLVIDDGKSLLKKTKKIENYFGIREISGEELLRIGREQAKAAGADIIDGEVVDIKFRGDVFEVKTLEGSFNSRYLVLAIGTRRSKPNIKNLERYIGRGISYCATCDAPFFRGKKVGVVGNTGYTVSEALELKDHASKVYILTNGRRLDVDEDLKGSLSYFEIVEEDIEKIEGNDVLRNVVFKSGKKIGVDGLFIAINPTAPETLVRKLGVMVKGELIVVDEDRRTNIPRLYAAGDCVNKDKQIGLAVADGIRVALSIIRDAKKIPKLH